MAKDLNFPCRRYSELTALFASLFLRLTIDVRAFDANEKASLTSIENFIRNKDTNQI